jgi:23S rRNA (adenine2503-C2)-methyltransferase
MSAIPWAFGLSHDEWGNYFTGMGQPSYRATQVCAWLWKRGVFNPEDMSDLGKDLRRTLSDGVDFSPPEIVRDLKSRDGTRKFLLRMRGGSLIESALIDQHDRLTACLSTQAGCPVGCPFCATGASGFERNLSAGEISVQFAVMEKFMGREISSAVFMGMGEPFLNTEQTLRAVRALNHGKARGLGIRHFTISTAGIVPGISAFTESGLGARLAVSLHAADNDLRNELVPCNTSYPLKDLMASMKRYQAVTGDRVTIEYALFKKKNDSVECARDLARFLKGLHVYVNLIPCNGSLNGYERSDAEAALRFQSVLKSAGFETEIRAPRGADISAACGQLSKSASP